MGQVLISISNELLVDVLNLPEGTKILSVFEGGMSPNSFGIRVAHPDLPDVAKNEPIPDALPVFRRVTSHAVEFEDWGLQ